MCANLEQFCATLLFFLWCAQVMAGSGKKRKTVRRGSSSQSDQPEYNSHLFRSLGCEKFHEKIAVDSKFVKERAFFLPPGEFEEIRQSINARGWEKFVAYPKEASRALVYEFFSNVFPKPAIDGDLVFSGSNSFVRGCEVPYDADTINELFGLAAVPISNCFLRNKISSSNLKANPELAAEVCATLCQPGADWVRNASGEPQKILVNSLTPVARGWAAFIFSTICPSSNQTDLNFPRATLASCIIRGEPVNLGWVLKNEITSFAKFKGEALPNYWRHASLVSLLCERAGVVANPNEATILPAVAITGGWIRARTGQEHPGHREELPQDQPDEQGPTFNIDDFSVGPSVDDFRELQARMDVLAANQDRMAERQEQMRRIQLRMEAENRFGMRALYRAMCTFQSGGQLDPDADIYHAPPPDSGRG